MCIYMYTHVCMCVSIFMCVFVFTCMHMCVCVRACMCMCMYVCVCDMCVSMCEDTTVFVWELSPLCGVIMYVGGLTRRWGWMETAAAVAVTAAAAVTEAAATVFLRLQ